MAEALLEHFVTRTGRCSCGTTLFNNAPETIAMHVAAELAKAGYGNMADAWDEGFTDCANEHTFQRIDATHPITRTNPYRGAGHE
jgi:hypothetical protein